MRRRSIVRELQNNLLVVWAVFVRDITFWLRYPSWIFTFIALPYTFSGLFYGMGYALAGPSSLKNFASKTGTENAFLYYTIGCFILLFTELVLGEVSASIRSEQLRGTFEINYVTPTNKLVLWSAPVIPHGLMSSGIMIASTLPVVIIEAGKLDPVNFFIAVMVLFLGILPLLGLGMVMAALTMRFKEPWAVINMVRVILYLLSGIYYPLTVLPEYLRYMAVVVPPNYMVDILRDLLIFQRKVILSDYRILALFILSSIYLILGFSLYRRWEQNARRTGEISKY